MALMKGLCNKCNGIMNSTNFADINMPPDNNLKDKVLQQVAV